MSSNVKKFPMCYQKPFQRLAGLVVLLILAGCGGEAPAASITSAPSSTPIVLAESAVSIPATAGIPASEGLETVATPTSATAAAPEATLTQASSIATTSPTAAATPASSPSPHPFAGEKAWIAYQTNRRGEGIWLIHPEGTDDHQILKDFQGDVVLPDWSPDGKKIVMTSRNTGGSEPLYVYDLATDTYKQLFACGDPCIGDDELAYSPDGTKVGFIRALLPFVNNGPSDCGLWIGDIATGNVTQIMTNTNPPCDREYFPRWSPDGSQLTYWRDLAEDGQPTGTAVFVINADGSDERRLTDPAMFAADPDWSPDGAWIVFSTYPPIQKPGLNPENLYRIHPDGSGLEQLTHYETGSLGATIPRYTPDGKWILFTAVKSQRRGLWIMPAEGGEPIVIAEGYLGEGAYMHGVWQP